MLMLLTITVVGFAQNFRGAINGIITDASGAIVDGCQVTATDEDTGVSYTTTASSAGEFSFQNLPLGNNYTIAVSQHGYLPLRVTGIHVLAGQVYNLPVKLQVASATTTVQVSAAAVALETTATALDTSLPTTAVQNVPMNARDFTQMIASTPGWVGNSTNGLAGSLNGARQNEINWQIEGSDDNDPWWNFPATNQTGVAGIAAVVVPLDAVDQFSVVTQGGAAMGRSPGGTVNLVFKSGTNQLHGTAYYFNHNEALAEASPFLAAGTKKPPIRNQNYGASLGGPFLRDRLFFFSTYEAQKFLLGHSALVTEPSLAYQAAALNLMKQYSVSENPVSANLLNTLWPANALTGPATSSNYHQTSPEVGHSHNGLGKIDYDFNARNRLELRAYDAFGYQLGDIGDHLLYYYAKTPVHSQIYNVTMNTVLSSHMENQALFSDNFFALAKQDNNTSFNPIALGLNTGVTSSLLSGSPFISIGAFDVIGSTTVVGRSAVTGTGQDNLSYLVGAHEMNFGGGVMQGRINGWYRAGERGSFYFNGSQGPWAALIGTPGFDSNIASLADFMAGDVYQSNIATGNLVRYVTMNGFNVYASDSWQMTHKLNINYGVRWEYVGPVHDSTKDLSEFDPAVPGGLAVAGEQIPNLYQRFFKDILPRVGFAYQPSSNMVIRAGAGIYSDTVAILPFLNNSNSLAHYGASNGGGIGVNSNPAGTQPVYLVQENGYTIVPNKLLFPSTPTIGGTNVINLFGVNSGLLPATVIGYNLNIQQSLGANAVLQIGYVGNESRHLLTLGDVNEAALGSGTALTASGFTKAQVSRPYFSAFPNFGVVNAVESNGTANYNGLQISLRTTDWHGLSTTVNYTWAHNLDDMTSNSGTLPQISSDLQENYGDADNDYRDQFNTFIVYDVPGSKYGPAWLTHGWEVGNVMTFHPGSPMYIKTSTDNTGTGENVDYGDYIGGNPYESNKIVNGKVQWLNPAAFAAPPPNTYGTYHRGRVRGPGFQDVDVSLDRNIPIRERLHAQFRFEMFNILNHTDLSGASGTIGSSAFGQTSDTTGDAAGAPGIGVGEPFNIQLGLKILW
jgi:hypothetical protein